MIRYLYFFMVLIILSCSKQEKAISQPDTTHQNSSEIKRYGKIILSFERQEFIYSGKTYHLWDKLGVFNDLINSQRNNGNGYLVEKDVCVIGAFSAGNSFGHLAQYESSFIVRELC